MAGRACSRRRSRKSAACQARRAAAAPQKDCASTVCAWTRGTNETSSSARVSPSGMPKRRLDGAMGCGGAGPGGPERRSLERVRRRAGGIGRWIPETGGRLLHRAPRQVATVPVRNRTRPAAEGGGSDRRSRPLRDAVRPRRSCAARRRRVRGTTVGPSAGASGRPSRTTRRCHGTSGRRRRRRRGSRTGRGARSGRRRNRAVWCVSFMGGSRSGSG